MAECLGYCEDCRAEPEYEDPKTPPLGLGKCLCRDCYYAHLDELIEELESELADLYAKRDAL